MKVTLFSFFVSSKVSPHLGFWDGCPTALWMLCPNLPALRQPAATERTETGAQICTIVSFPRCYSSITRLLFLPSAGVMQWVTQGLTKVLPQPDDKYKEPKGEQEDHTEVSSKFRSPATPGPGNGAAKQVAKAETQTPQPQPRNFRGSPKEPASVVVIFFKLSGLQTIARRPPRFLVRQHHELPFGSENGPMWILLFVALLGLIKAVPSVQRETITWT